MKITDLTNKDKKRLTFTDVPIGNIFRYKTSEGYYLKTGIDSCYCFDHNALYQKAYVSPQTEIDRIYEDVELVIR